MIMLMFSFPGAAVIPEYTSPSFRNTGDKVILYSLPVLDYVRSPELILEVGAPKNRKTKVGEDANMLLRVAFTLIFVPQSFLFLSYSCMDPLAVSLLSISSPRLPQVLRLSF